MAKKKTVDFYMPSNYGKEEIKLMEDFHLQLDDARQYFLTVTKPRLDRSYKLYIAYTGDRKKEIKSWQANIFVPYTLSVVETLMPRILDARPEFTVSGRTADDNAKAEKQKLLGDYDWERAGMDKTTEDFTRAALIYGTGYLQVSWKKDVRKLKFLKTKDIAKKTYEWKEEERVFYDAPYAEWVDNYSLFYDWHNTDRKSKQYWFKRLVLTEAEIKRRYPMHDVSRLAMAIKSGGGDLTDYAAVRQQVKFTHENITKSSAFLGGAPGDDKYKRTTIDQFEVFEWTRPFDDTYSVHVGGGHVPIFKDGFMPIPFDFKEAPFIDVPYLKIPGEFEGYGLPIILENPQIMLNLIKNQRLDATTLSIHKMWIVNPLANVNKKDLVTRPFGIIYSIDPNGVKEVQFGDIKPSAYKEEELLKNDMRYSSGVDDFSMGAGGGLSGGGATAVRHLRESTLERVRLFVNHLGDAYADVLRYWMDMHRQLMTDKMTIRIIGDSGQTEFPLIEKDDLMGYFDYTARVLPSIAGQQDVEKKQAMDLFQLLSQIDPQASGVSIKKLVAKLVDNWDWSVESITEEQPPQQPGMNPEEQMSPEQMMQQGGMPPGQEGMPPPEMMPGAQGPGMPPPPQTGPQTGKFIPPQAMSQALAMLRNPSELANANPMAQMAGPVNLLNSPGTPPTAQGLPSASGGAGPGWRYSSNNNSRGLNRTGRVNTTIPTGKKTSTESNLLNQSSNLQR